MRGRPLTILASLAMLACHPAPAPSMRTSVRTQVQAPVDDEPTIDADSGTSVGSAGVWLTAYWRVQVVPRALLIVIPSATQSPRSLVAFANRSLDDRFIHAIVESKRPLAQQIHQSTDLAAYKVITMRPALDAGRPRTSVITALLIDGHDGNEDDALAALRNEAAYAVQVAIVLSDDSERRREVLEFEWSARIDVLTLPGLLDDAATWAEIVAFIDEVAHDRGYQPADTPESE
ncbi:MAG: hypothetical protein KC457_11125 [Myxococcales bacterium]|nr:hypothetical protein [Myxococcales bacterium]